MCKHLKLGILLLALAISGGCGDGDEDGKNAASGGKTDNGDGNDLVITGLDQKPRVLIEGETAKSIVKPFKINDKAEDSDASGGKYLTLPSAGCGGNHNHIAGEGEPARTAGSAELEFEVAEEGEYALWVRKWSCCSCGDSWTMRIDDGKVFTFGNQGTNHKIWSWLAHQDRDGRIKVKLTAGKHKLKLTNRGESGFRIDQILFWANLKRVPQGKEKP